MNEEEMKELVKVCSRWKQAKLEMELQQLKRKPAEEQLKESQQPSEGEQKKAKDTEENQGEIKEDNPEGSEKQEG